MMPGLNEFFLVDGFFFRQNVKKVFKCDVIICVLFFFLNSKKGDFFFLSLISSPFLDVIDNPFQSLVEPETYE